MCYSPYVFTEQGVASLSAVLSSNKAIGIHFQIMRAFISLRDVVRTNTLLSHRIDRVENQLYYHWPKIRKSVSGDWRQKIQPQQGVFFNGQVFDAYVFVCDLIKRAKKSIIIIDNYIDESVLTLLSKRHDSCTATIYTQAISKQLKLDLERHNA